MGEPKFTPGPWEYIASTEHHGPYVSGPWGGDVCDCYTMSNPSAWSTRNGGESYPIPHQGDAADANAHLIAAAPELYEALAPMEERLTVFPHDLDEGDDEEVEVTLTRRELKRMAAAIAKARGDQ